LSGSLGGPVATSVVLIEGVEGGVESLHNMLILPLFANRSGIELLLFSNVCRPVGAVAHEIEISEYRCAEESRRCTVKQRISPLLHLTRHR